MMHSHSHVILLTVLAGCKFTKLIHLHLFEELFHKGCSSLNKLQVFGIKLMQCILVYLRGKIFMKQFCK